MTRFVSSDGEIPFVRPQAGVDPVDDADLVTKSWAVANLGGGGGAPTTVDYLVKTASGSLSAERVVTDTSTVAWDWATAGQAKAAVPDSSIGTAKLGGDITSAGKALLDDANATAQRTTLGLGALATQSSVGAADVVCDDSSWAGNLNGVSPDAQSALDAIDDLIIGSGGITHAQVLARSLGS